MTSRNRHQANGRLRASAPARRPPSAASSGRTGTDIRTGKLHTPGLCRIRSAEPGHAASGRRTSAASAVVAIAVAVVVVAAAAAVVVGEDEDN